MAEDVFGIVGSVIAGAYHVEAVVAEGGFGVVYRAHHGGFRAPVALKLLKVPPQSSAQQSEFLELFRAEAELSFRLAASIPAVARPLHVDAMTSYDGRFVPYIVLEWLEGMTLDELIKQRERDGAMPLALKRLVQLLTPVARALERAHNFTGPEGRVSIVHRDLKPENIFIAEVAGEQVVKVLDFGIGKVKNAASQVAGRLSQGGAVPTAFTPAYGAPEQWAPKQFGQTGPWTDVWGLALCMVEALTGKPAINGETQEMMGIALDPRRRPTPRTLGAYLPEAAEAVFARALALDPRDRQRDAGAFWNELLESLEMSDGERPRSPSRELRTDSLALALDRAEPRPRPSTTLGRAQPTAAVERALAMDLEFDPMSAPARPGAVSETRKAAPAVPAAPAVRPAASLAAPPKAAPPVSQVAHFVPDLEIAPPPRRMSGQLPAVTPPARAPTPEPRPIVTEPTAHTSGAHSALLDFGEAEHESSGIDLHLDLPADEPILRRASSAGMRAVDAPSALENASQAPPVSEPRPARREAPPPVSGAAPARPIALDLPPPSPPVSQRGALPDLAPASNPKPLETGFVAKIELPEERPLFVRMRPALALLILAVLLTIFDPVYAAITGEKLEILGARPSVFGGVLLLVALALAGREVFREP